MWGTDRNLLSSYDYYGAYFMHIVNSLRLDQHLEQLDVFDILSTFFDKNFFYIWNYF